MRIAAAITSGNGILMKSRINKLDNAMLCKMPKKMNAFGVANQVAIVMIAAAPPTIAIRLVNDLLEKPL